MTDALLQQTKDQVTILNAAGEDEGMASELVRQYFLIVLNDLADLQILDEALASSIDRPVSAHGW